MKKRAPNKKKINSRRNRAPKVEAVGVTANIEEPVAAAEPPRSPINYTGIAEWVYARPRLVTAIRWTEIVSVVLVVITYVLFGVLMAIIDSPLRAVVYIIVTEVAFFGVSMMRVWINLKRPFEIYDFASLGITVGCKAGRAFPSRHVFSAFIIGMLLLPSLLPVGIVVMVIGILLGFTRVITGKHFLRDVLVGAGLGVLLGAIGMISMALIG